MHFTRPADPYPRVSSLYASFCIIFLFSHMISKSLLYCYAASLLCYCSSHTCISVEGAKQMWRPFSFSVCTCSHDSVDYRTCEPLIFRSGGLSIFGIGDVFIIRTSNHLYPGQKIRKDRSLHIDMYCSTNLLSVTFPLCGLLCSPLCG